MRRSLFSLLLLGLLLAPILSQIPFSAAEEPDRSLVLQNFEIGFNPIHNTDPHVKPEKGGKSFVDFRNLGILEIGEGEVIFKAMLTIEFSTNVYTDYWIDQMYSGVRENELKIKFLKLISDPNWVTAGDRDTEIYYAHANEYRFEDTTEGSTTSTPTLPTLGFGGPLIPSSNTADSNTYTPATYLATGVDDVFNLGIRYVNFEEKYLQAEEYNDTLKINKPIIEPIECRVSGSSVQSLDTYLDLFVGNVQANVSIIDLTDDTGYRDQAGEAADDIDNKVADKGEEITSKLGVRGETPYLIEATYPDTGAVIPGGALKVSSGHILTKAGDNNFTIHLTNRPQPFSYMQNIRYNYALVEVDTQDGIIKEDAGIRNTRDQKQDDLQRIIGYRINNFNLQTNFTVDFICYSHVEMDPEDQEYYLGIPEFVKGDIIWDISLFGDTGASLIFTDPYDYLHQPGDTFMAWVAQYWWVLAIIGIGGFLFFMFKGQMEAAAWKKALT
jgi:hypothetical protein